MPVEDSEFTRLLWQFIYLSIGVALLVYGWMLFSLFRYRHKEGDPLPHDAPQAGSWPRERHHRQLEIAWTVGPTILVIILAAISLGPLDAIWSSSDDPVIIHVEGSQWVWVFTYPEDNDTVSVNELRVTHSWDRSVELQMTSSDVLHSFWIPALGLKEDLVPGQTTRLRFDPQDLEVGEYDIVCAEFCGQDHANMWAKLIVEA